METATFSKLLGTFILNLLAGLIPAAQPFCAKAQLSDAAFPVGIFTMGEQPPWDQDTLLVEKRGPHRYRLTLSDRTTKLAFEGRLFEVEDPGQADASRPGARERKPVYFLDLEPRMARPEKHGIPAGTKHLAVSVHWEERRDSDGDMAWLTFDTVRKDWLDEQEPTLKLPTAKLRALLKKGLAEGAFGGRIELRLWDPRPK